MGLLKKFVETLYNDIPDWLSENPDCPECGETMGYNYGKCEFKCPSCGYVVDEDDLDYDDDDDVPFGCSACGGPYPKCKTSCKMFDD